jgi:hypothetical protein
MAVGSSSPLVVVGSVNADIYVEIERLPMEGETIAAGGGETLPGGKGANQAACAARLSFPTYLCAQVLLLLLIIIIMSPFLHSCSNLIVNPSDTCLVFSSNCISNGIEVAYIHLFGIRSPHNFT